MSDRRQNGRLRLGLIKDCIVLINATPPARHLIAAVLRGVRHFFSF